MSEPGLVSGFVSLVGRPNAGKSTLLNALVGDKLAIVSDKPQTTRTTIQGVVNMPGAQIVFLDTPGIHQSSSLLNRRMMDTIQGALEERDVVLFLADAGVPMQPDDRSALQLLERVKSPVFLVLNKVDRVRDKRELLPRIEEYRAVREFTDYFPVSALKGEGLEKLKQAIVAKLPEGPAYFPEDFVTDQPERFLAAEVIREKLLRETRQEVPHAVAVLIEKWEDTPRITRISATIYVERAGQKAIVIGPKGGRLKIVGTKARLELEALLQRKIFLELFVKVRPNWRQSPEFLDAIDWRSMTGSDLSSLPEGEE